MQDRDAHDASDAELLEACREGDTDGFSLLWERHQHAGRVAARNLAPGLDADDLVADAYFKIFALVCAGQGPTGAFRPYLYQTIKTIAADALRSPEEATPNLEEIPELHETGPWEDDAFDLNATARAFASLPERWQSVLWYTEVEGMPPREVAPLLGISPNGVSALAARAREGLQTAWVNEHLNMQLAEDDCRSTLENLQRYQRGKLTAGVSRTVEAHLQTCPNCASADAESRAISKQLALVLATIFVGGGAAAAFAGGLAPKPDGSAASTASGGGSAGTTASTSAAAASSGTAAAGSGLAALVSAPAALIAGSALAALAIVTTAVLVISSITAPSASEAGAPEPTDTSQNPPSPEPEPEPREQEPDPPEPARSDPEPPTSTNDVLIKVAQPAEEPARPHEPVAPPTPISPPVPIPGPEPGPEPEPEPEPEPVDGDPAILLGFECFLPGVATLGAANEYGVIRLRASHGSSAPVEILDPMYDPAFEGIEPGNVFTDGIFNDPYGNTFDFGFYTGTDPDPGPYDWFGQDPTGFPAWASEFGSTPLIDITLEMRLVAPDGRYSPWTAIDPSVSC